MQHRRFFLNLGSLGAALMLIVASIAFGPGGVLGVGLGIGIAGALFSIWFVASTVHHRRLEGSPELRIFGVRLCPFSVIAGVMASVAIWQIVQVSVFDFDASKWLTLADGLVIGLLGCIGLVLHEVSSERVTHVLEVVERPTREA